MSTSAAILGIDLGGTAIKGLALARDGSVLAEAARATGDTGDASWREQVSEVFRELVQRVPQVKAVGVCAPGLAARDERSIAAMPGRLQGLVGFDWEEQFRLPTRVLNDGHAALLGEIWQGAARGGRNVLMLTLGTGVGGAAMVDGRLLRGQLGRAGHFGHLSLNPEGPPDIVGTPGSLEDAIGDCTVSARSGGRFATSRALLEAARAGDRPARDVWDVSIRALAAALAGLVNAFDPEKIVIGGGIAGAGEDLFKPLLMQFDAMEWRIEGARVSIVPALLGARAGAFGAAYRAHESLAL